MTTKLFLSPKISPPKLRGISPRKRLFNLIHHASDQKIFWITSPPGSGKTTFAASYSETLKIPIFWYQLDSGDADLGSFFHYLSQTISRSSPHQKRPFPLFAPDYLGNPGLFSRIYFREMVQRVKKPFVLVLDNYQEVPADSPFHSMLADGIEELPEGYQTLILSRESPPPPFARFNLAGRMMNIGWEDIRLTEKETFDIARSYRGIERSLLKKIFSLTEGWAAGIFLLLEQAKKLKIPSVDIENAAPQVLFDYFASEIFERTEKEVQNVLLRLSVIPRISSSLAEAICESPAAPGILNNLSKRNYFTVRFGEKESVYQFHALFRDFLLRTLHKSLPAGSIKELKIRAGELLFSAGQIESAADLMIEAGDWNGLESLLHTVAPKWIETGRFQNLERLLRAFPPEQLTRHPWLLYFLGICRLPFEGPKCRPYFEQAFDLFNQIEDVSGLYLSWCGIIDTFGIVWVDFRPVDCWISAFDDLRQRFPAFPSPEIEARVTYGIFSALSYRNTGHPDFLKWAERARSLLFTVSDLQFRAMIFRELMNYYIWVDGNIASAKVILDEMKPFFHVPGIPPFVKIIWNIAECHYYLASAESQASREAAERVLQMTAEMGIHFIDDLLYSWMIWGAVTSNHLQLAGEIFSGLSKSLNRLLPLNVSFYHTSAGHLTFSEGDYVSAREHFLAAIPGLEQVGIPLAVMHNHGALAHVYLAMGDIPSAMNHFKIVRAIASEKGSQQVMGYMGPLTEAAFALKEGNETAIPDLLRRAFFAGRSRQIYNPLWSEPKVLSELCLRALEKGIETDYVRELIRRRGLTVNPASPGSDLWPWRLKIYNLGRFALEIDGTPLEFQGRTPRKPLEFLMVLIALGGRSVHQERLTEILWPDVDGDSAHEAFAVNLRRLRKLLGEEKTVSLQNKTVSLDESHVWVDTWAFGRLTRQIQEECSYETLTCSLFSKL
ncbi:MAG: hypothetical protein HY202_08545, partial [Nitrospirae bacterium]|nr:hypothetical protein [Nitrospirota bacterium]